MEQYYHAPGKLCTMVLEVGARALTKHALNVHCGHDDFYAALDTGWTMLVARDAQQAADSAIVLRKVNELSLNPGMNIQDGMLTTHSERTYLAPEAELLREFLGGSDDMIDCPTPAQRELFGAKRRRVPEMMDLKNPILLGPVQNQEHHMNGVVARRNNFNEHILPMLEQAYEEFGRLTGRHYGLLVQYKCDDADTVFVSLGCAAENIEEACDYLREQRNAKVGSIHVNVIRPFPEAALINALRGKKNVIILERTDEGLAGDNPLARDIRVALGKANEVTKFGGALPSLTPDEVPRIFRGAYGIGSRDFRPEHVLGAYEYATGQTRRKDGKGAADGETYFVLGVDHPYAVISKATPSLLPQGAIAVRFHSIGGWGMITTGKNLGSIIGEFGDLISNRNPEYDADGRVTEKLFVMANPKYGSEKKGAPTNYYLTVAPDRIKVNCELNHVDVVLCCDPKAFTHTNPLEGLNRGGCLVWESSDIPENAWQRVPAHYRKFIKENNIRIFILPGFEIARKATNQTELQLRMQGNSFLGAFFRVSPFLKEFGISEEQFHNTVHKQYEKKFARFGEAVVTSNMTVMTEGFSRVQEIKYGDFGDPDRSSMRNPPVLPNTTIPLIPTAGCGNRVRLRNSHARVPDAALLVPDDGQVRQRIPQRLRISPARRRARIRWGDGRRFGRDAVQVCRAPGDARLHRGKLHTVHGVHHRLPRYRAAEHGAGCLHGFENGRELLHHRCRRASKTRRRAEGSGGTRARKDERGDQEQVEAAVPRHHSRRDRRPRQHC